jgi:hypothetical protein
LVLPIIVGLVIVAAQFLVDNYKTTREVSAIIEGPFAFSQIHDLLDKAKLSVNVFWDGKQKPNSTEEQKPVPGTPAAPPRLGVRVEVDVNRLQIYKVTIRNTGNTAIRDLTVRFVFENATDNFSVFAVQHKTNPPYEFGKITPDSEVITPDDDFTSPRFTYELLNPRHEDVVTVLASERANLKIYAKGEGVSLNVTNAAESAAAADRYLQIAKWLVAAIIVLFLLFIMAVRRLKILAPIRFDS